MSGTHNQFVLLLCAAVTVKRILLSPTGTVGGRIPVPIIPALYK